jgi:hypothetical protein
MKFLFIAVTCLGLLSLGACHHHQAEPIVTKG